MLATLYSCGTVLTILVASHGVGRQVLRRLNLSELPSLALVAWSLVLGLIAHAGLFSLAAFAGILSAGFVGGVTVVTCFWGLGELACAYLNFRAPHRAKVAELNDLITTAPSIAMPRWLHGFAMLLAVAICGIALVAALTPPISACVLASSLNVPKHLIITGPQRVPLAWAELTSPQFTGMLYAWAYALDSPVTAALLNWTCGVLLLSATALLAKPLVGSHYAWLAGLLPLTAPGLRYQMTIPLADLPTAMFCTFALAAWWRGVVEQSSRRWLVVAGLCWGASLATSAAALGGLAAAALVWCNEVSRSAEQRYTDLAWRGTLIFVVALALATPWWTFTLVNAGELAPTAHQLAEWLQLGPLWLAVLPGLLLARRLRGMHLIGGLALSVTATTWLMVPQSRVFLLALPLLAVLGTWVLMELARYPRVPRWAISILLIIICVVPLTRSFRKVTDQLSVVVGWQSREDYLRRHVPTYAAAQVANRLARPEAVLASNDPHLLYFDCHTRVIDAGGPAISLAKLQASGVTHVLWRHDAGNPPTMPTDENAEASLPLTQYTAMVGDDNRLCHYELRLLLRQ